MAGLSAAPAGSAVELRGPGNARMFAIIAELRWRLLLNSLRTIRGRLEALSRVFAAVTMTTLSVGGAVGLAIVSYIAVDNGHLYFFNLIFWGIFLFWQMYPVLGSAFSAPFEFGSLLRFPMSFSSFYFLNLTFGLLDPISLVCLLWLLGVSVGVGIANVSLLPWTILALFIFGAMNVLLSRTVYVWLERWLAKRRTREALGILFLFMMIGFQFIGPFISRWQRHGSPKFREYAYLFHIADFLPPGLAKLILTDASRGDQMFALLAVVALAAYALGIAALLGTRLHAQFIGENLNESLAPTVAGHQEKSYAAWDLRLLPTPVAAIFEKEVRYLLRSAPIIFTFVMPLFVLAMFRFVPMRGSSGSGSSILLRAPDWAFPVGAGYALLILANIVYNSFGADGPGLQFFLTAPVRLRDVLLAKNLAHSAVLVLAVSGVLITTIVLYRPPSLAVTFGTVAALLFALPLNLAAGNMMSIYSPKKYDFGAFNRQRTTGATAFVSMGVEALVVGIAAAVFFLSRYLQRVWLAGFIFLPLAAVSIVIYWFILNLAERRALERREILVAEICRT
jgi:ABC-2 type transport system permease protein